MRSQLLSWQVPRDNVVVSFCFPRKKSQLYPSLDTNHLLYVALSLRTLFLQKKSLSEKILQLSMELIVSTVQTAGVDDPSLQKQQHEQQEETVKTVTRSANRRVGAWPEFKVPLPDPVLGKYQLVCPQSSQFIEGFTGEIFCGKGALSPEQTLVEFISTSAAFHEVKKQPLRSLEWDLLKVGVPPRVYHSCHCHYFLLLCLGFPLQCDASQCCSLVHGQEKILHEPII